jgi:hypothetical protein
MAVTEICKVRFTKTTQGFRFLEGSTRKDGRARSAPRSDEDSPAGAYTPITGMRCTGALIYTRSSHMAFPLCVLASSFAAPKTSPLMKVLNGLPLRSLSRQFNTSLDPLYFAWPKAFRPLNNVAVDCQHVPLFKSFSEVNVCRERDEQPTDEMVHVSSLVRW